LSGFVSRAIFAALSFSLAVFCQRFSFEHTLGKSGDCLSRCFSFGGGVGCSFDGGLLDFWRRLERRFPISDQFLSLLESFLGRFGGFGIVAIFARSLGLQIETVGSGRNLVLLEIDLQGRIVAFPSTSIS